MAKLNRSFLVTVGIFACGNRDRTSGRQGWDSLEERETERQRERATERETARETEIETETETERETMI